MKSCLAVKLWLTSVAADPVSRNANLNTVNAFVDNRIVRLLLAWCSHAPEASTSVLVLVGARIFVGSGARVREERVPPPEVCPPEEPRRHPDAFSTTETQPTVDACPTPHRHLSRSFEH